MLFLLVSKLLVPGLHFAARLVSSSPHRTLLGEIPRQTAQWGARNSVPLLQLAEFLAGLRVAQNRTPTRRVHQGAACGDAERARAASENNCIARSLG